MQSSGCMILRDDLHTLCGTLWSELNVKAAIGKINEPFDDTVDAFIYIPTESVVVCRAAEQYDSSDILTLISVTMVIVISEYKV